MKISEKAYKKLKRLENEYNKIFDAMGYEEDRNVIEKYNLQLNVLVEKMDKIIAKEKAI